MLFNSTIFILVFLPAVLVLYYVIDAERWRQRLVIAASLLFYAYADVRFLPLIVGSVLVNWLLAGFLHERRARLALPAGLVVNLGLLAYFKYRDFFAEILFAILDTPYQSESLILPIGISFFTFQQIAYLVDLERGKAPRYPLQQYAFFVTFFPQLIAGPIVRHDQLIPQLLRVEKRPFEAFRFGFGCLLFATGLVKKFIFADGFAPHVDAVYAAASNGAVSALDAWSGTLGFAFQIYFDFSAYSDMAIGLALLMGLRLPVNFASPYRAVSIQEFWRRWHITLSSFFRDYLYIPLGGNRHGLGRQILNLHITMMLCGLWHGAGWNFVGWGLWHAIGLSALVLWRHFGGRMPPLLGWAATALFILFGWVLFRSPDVTTVRNIYASMMMLAPDAPRVAEALPGTLAIVAAIVVLALPNSQTIVDRWATPRGIIGKVTAVAAAIVVLVITLELSKGQSVEFIYFEF